MRENPPAREMVMKQTSSVYPTPPKILEVCGHVGDRRMSVDMCVYTSENGRGIAEVGGVLKQHVIKCNQMLVEGSVYRGC